MKLGRRDARTASQAAANNSIPPPTSNLNNLISFFSNVGLSTRDMVALSGQRCPFLFFSFALLINYVDQESKPASSNLLSAHRISHDLTVISFPGAHTIGQARCTNFRARIYNETNIDASLAQTRKKNCPGTSGVGDNNLAPLDLQSPTYFDNNYYKNLVQKRGLLHSDQQLFNGGSTDSLVRTYSSRPSTFSSDFIAAMIRMGDIKPLTGSSGEIRKNCRRVN